MATGKRKTPSPEAGLFPEPGDPWTTRWAEEEAAIMAQYEAWPPEARAMFVMKLESLGRHLRMEKHSHEIIDRSGETW